MKKRWALAHAVIGAAAAMFTYTLLHDEGGWPKAGQNQFMQLCVDQGKTKDQCKCSLHVAEDFLDSNSKLIEVQKTGQMPAGYADTIRRNCS